MQSLIIHGAIESKKHPDPSINYNSSGDDPHFYSMGIYGTDGVARAAQALAPRVAQLNLYIAEGLKK